MPVKNKGVIKERVADKTKGKVSGKHKETKNKSSAYSFHVESVLAHETMEDIEQSYLLDDIESYLDSEAHALVEQDMMSGYQDEFGSMDGYEEMLEDKLLSNIHMEESSDLVMYNRIYDRLNSVSSPEARRALLAKYAPEILKGKRRSAALLARATRALEKAKAIDARRRRRVIRHIYLKPKQQKMGKENEHPGRTIDNGGGYPY